MKYLVLGAGGMAGHLVTIYLQEQKEDVTGVARRELYFCKSVRIDITNFKELNDLIQLGGFDCIINCIGVLNVKAEKEPDNAIMINSYLPWYLCGITQQQSCKIIQISTDCVFSGNTGHYDEKSWPDADTLYGRTKALGEIKGDNRLTFRTSIIGPDINHDGVGLFNWFMRQNEYVDGYTNAIWTGVTTLELAKAIYKASKIELNGLYHLVNNEIISKYDMLNLFKKYFNKNIEIHKSESVVYNKSLVNTRNDCDFRIPSYDEQIREMSIWIRHHKSLYMQYAWSKYASY